MHIIKSKEIIKISERVASHVDKSLFILEFSAGYNLVFFAAVVVVFFHLRSSGAMLEYRNRTFFYT